MNLRRKLNRTENDEMFDLKTDVLIWRLFMSTTMKSAIQLGVEYDENFDRVPELRRDQDVVRCLSEVDCGKFIRNSESIYDDV